MASFTLGRLATRTTQPQGKAEIDWSNPITRGLVLATQPGVSLTNIATGSTPSISGASPTKSHKVTTPMGVGRTIHPGGGTDGYGAIRYYSDPAGSSDDWTLIWVGRPLNLGSVNGQLMRRGSDLAGNGWNIGLAYEGTVQVSAYFVDSSPALRAVSLPVVGANVINRLQRIALVKSGATLTIYDFGTRAKASATFPSSALRTSSAGFSLGTNENGAPSGHNEPAIVLALATDLPDAAVWGLLTNPWQIFKPDQPTMRFAPRLAGAPAGNTLTTASCLNSSTSSNVTVTQVHQLVTSGSGRSAVSSNVAVTQVHSLSLANSLQASVSSTLAVGTAGTLSVSTTSQNAISSNVAVTQVHSLSLANSLQTSVSSTLAVGTAGALSVSTTSQNAVSSNVAVTQVHSLSLANSLQTSVSSTLVVGTAGTLSVSTASQNAVSSSVAVTQIHSLMLDGSFNAAFSSALSVGGVSILSVAPSSGLSSSVSVSVQVQHNLTVGSTSQSGTSGTAFISLEYSLSASTSVSAAASSSVVVSSIHALNVANANATNVASFMTISLGVLVVPVIKGRFIQLLEVDNFVRFENTNRFIKLSAVNNVVLGG
jgi:hypothetical protein